MKHTAVDWLSNQAYELFEQYSEGKFDRIKLNKLMVNATNKAKKMEKKQILSFAKLYDDDLSEGKIRSREDLYKETYGK